MVAKAPFRRARKLFTPIAEGVVVQLDEKTVEGLVLPQGVQDTRESPTGIVIAVGKECKYVKEGDRVILSNNPPHKVVYGGEPALFVTVEPHLLGVVIKDGN